jgi:hypothetical protein
MITTIIENISQTSNSLLTFRCFNIQTKTNWYIEKKPVITPVKFDEFRKVSSVYYT